MAAEITVELSVSFRKGSSMDGLDPGPISVTMTGTNILRNRQTVGFAAEEALLLGDVPAGGWAIFVNRDASNYVRIRGLSGQTPLVRLRAGEPAAFRIDAGATPTVQADTAAVELDYLLVED